MSKGAPISQRLREFLGYTDEDDEEVQEWCNEKLKSICKPCWELKYCPYGSMVEGFPLPPMTKKDYLEHNEYLRECIETGMMGTGEHRIPLPPGRRELFIRDINRPIPDSVVDTLSDFEEWASCMEYGHLCPAYFAAEPYTETKSKRKLSRSIPNSVLIRVVRRDNNTCQACGKILLDREIEIDHIIPYSRGGISEESNLRVTCLDCNRSKIDKLSFIREKDT